MDDVYRTLAAINERFSSIEKNVGSLGSVDTTALSFIHPTSHIINNQSINDGVTMDTANLVTASIVPVNTLGVFGMLIGNPSAVGAYLAISPKGDTPDFFSPRINTYVTSVSHSGLVMCKLGTDKALTLKAVGADFINVYFYLVGYWK